MAQFGITKLPFYFGEITHLLTMDETYQHDPVARQQMMKSVWRAFGSVIVYVVLRSVTNMLLKLVGMHWRAVLSRRFMQLYLDGAVMYKVRRPSPARSTQPATRPKAPARVRTSLRARPSHTDGHAAHRRGRCGCTTRATTPTSA